jgi:hypothetical protein
MTGAQLDYTSNEILADPPIVEPLRAAGLECHGGFLDDGTYASPRTLHRVPAIQAWQDSHRKQFGTEILDAPMDSWPGNFPNLDQAQLLLGEGVRDPIVALLTRVGTIEGFGAVIRHLAPADMQPFFAEDVRATAMGHLGRGLVEAHARDEAGWDDKAGHDRMWFAVRDIAFEHPVTEDQTQAILLRMGLGGGGDGRDERSARFQAQRLFPDLDLALELLVDTMCRVLFIEIKAFHVFAWAEALLSNDDLVAGEGEAARIVSYIRNDETPHVDYLRTALTEMRDRTFVGLSGRHVAGTEVIGRLWDKSLASSMGTVETQNRVAMSAEVAAALKGHARGSEILEQFRALGDWHPMEAA